ncbi:hypothetical protein BOO91_19360 [Vibrio navarrensis]|nr:hypothetical protein [Vibrio navarrensis]MBE4605610.1 hypothetical protein [Vibrio navarrensis]
MVLGKAKADKEGTSFLGTRLLGRARAEKQELKRRFWVLGSWSWEKKKQETSFLEARLRGKAKAEEKDRSFLLFPRT